MDACPQLPEEIVMEILLMLPVKYVLRFKAVCKSWYSIINHKGFAKRHLNISLAAPDWNFFSPCYYGHYPSNPLLLYKQDAEGAIHAKAVDIPPEYHFSSFRNSCDGLFCFFDNGNREQIFVWNPCLPTQVKIVPSLPFPNNEIALGYDPTSNDYKIVKVRSHCLTRDKYIRVETFSFKSDSWKTMRFPICNPVYYRVYPAMVYANHRVYWFAREYYEEGIRTCIMYFDLAQESLKLMNMPPGSQNCLTLMNYKDSIATILDQFLDQSIEYWVLEYCCTWKKMFRLNCMDLSWTVGRCIGVTLNGESFIRMKEGGFRIYDLKDGSLVLGNDVTHINERAHYFSPFPYIQTLLSPRNLN